MEANKSSIDSGGPDALKHEELSQAGVESEAPAKPKKARKTRQSKKQLDKMLAEVGQGEGPSDDPGNEWAEAQAATKEEEKPLSERQRKLQPVRALVDLRSRTLQKARIGFSNRMGAIERGADKAAPETKEMFEKWFDLFSRLEKEADKDIGRLVDEFEIVKHMIQVKGLGKLLAAQIISMVDIERSNNVSQLWRYAGYAVIDGKRERPVKGETLHYNIRLKTSLYLVGSSFLRCKSPYRKEYDEARAKFEARLAAGTLKDDKGKDWTAGHIHQASMRKMIKVFLAHFWRRYRELEGLPVRDLYVMEYGGHQTYIEAEEYGWPPLAQG